MTIAKRTWHFGLHGQAADRNEQGAGGASGKFARAGVIFLGIGGEHLEGSVFLTESAH
jgi:hypothetical protein